MNPKTFLLAVLTVLFTCAIASAQVEEITLSTYYPAPYGEYEEMAAEKLFADKVIIGNMDVDGDGIDSTPADIAAMGVGSLLIENNLGIGTTNPYGGVHIKKSGQALNLQTENTADTFDIQFYDADDVSGSYKWDLSYRGNSIGDDLYLYKAGGGAPVMVWDYATGNVGIGITNPNVPLHVAHNIRIEETVVGARSGMWLTTPDGWASILSGGGHSNGVGFYTASDLSSAKMVIASTGNVGIGTTSPTTKLHIGGTAGVDGIRFPDGTLQTTAAGGIGTVANVVMVQTRAQATYSAPPSGYGTIVTPLNLVITPKKAGNRIILEWIVNGEMHQDTVYIVTRNGALLAGTTNAANNRWAGITAQPYDGNHSSTPDNTVVKIIDMNSLNVATTYELRVRSSYGAATTLYLNRTFASTGQNNYEASLSVGTATEIWQ